MAGTRLSTCAGDFMQFNMGCGWTSNAKRCASKNTPSIRQVAVAHRHVTPGNILSAHGFGFAPKDERLGVHEGGAC